MSQGTGRIWNKQFLFPTASGKKVKVAARFLDPGDGTKPTIQIYIKRQIDKTRMKSFDYRLLSKMLEDIFTYLRKDEDRDVADYLNELERHGGPKIPLREKVRVAKKMAGKAWRNEDLMKDFNGEKP